MKLPIARKLIRWYESAARDLPWRRTRDPWRILVSEVMLQQTRVETVLPYYDRFLARYPAAAAMAAAPTGEILALWAGLGYYSRARNLHAAARRIVQLGGFPATHAAIRELPGIGDYTAAAVASLCFDLPHAVVDGNVLRVVARLTNDASDIRSSSTRSRFAAIAQSWLDPKRPAPFNQAMMELGATVCVPRNPRCPLCPVSAECQGRAAGRERELPVKLKSAAPVRRAVTLYVIARGERILMWKRGDEAKRMRGFWELPGAAEAPAARPLDHLGKFSHSITNNLFEVSVDRAGLRAAPPGCVWVPVNRLGEIPVSTITRKALAFHL